MKGVPKFTKAQEAYIREACDCAYKNGYSIGSEHGYAKGKAAAESTLESRRVLLQLVNSIGQTLQAQNQIVTGLANVLDNAGGLR